MKQNTLLYIGGAGLLAYLYLTKSPNNSAPGIFSSVLPGVPQTVTPTTAGAPPTPTTFDKNYYLTYQYPAILAANPNIGNPNYRLTDSEANQYLANYLDLQQAWADPGNHNNPGWDRANTPQDFARSHWRQWAIPDKRTFTLLVPSSTTTYNDPHTASNSGFFTSIGNFIAKNSSTLLSQGGNLLTNALKTAPAAAAIAGINDTPTLSPKDRDTILNGSGIVLSIYEAYSAINQYKSDQAIQSVYNVLNQLL